MDDRYHPETPLKKQKFFAQTSLVGGTQNPKGEIEHIHVPGNGMEGIGLGVVASEAMARAGYIAEELGDRVEEVDELGDKEPMANDWDFP